MKAFRLVAISIALLSILIVFTSAKPIKTDKDEVIVIGRLLIDSPLDSLHFDKLSIKFETIRKGSTSVKINSDGFFCAKIKFGGTFIDYIQYKHKGTYRKIFTDRCAAFVVGQEDKVHYIGDIQMEWTPSKRDKIQQGFSIGIGMGSAHMGGGIGIPIQSAHSPQKECPNIELTEYTDAVNWYKEIYPDDTREIVTTLIQLP